MDIWSKFERKKKKLSGSILDSEESEQYFIQPYPTQTKLLNKFHLSSFTSNELKIYNK